MAEKTKQSRIIRRKHRTRAKIRGTAARPRAQVSTSLTGMYVQLIDDGAGKTLVAARDSATGATGTKTERSAALGACIAEKAKAAGIGAIVFDRGAKKYHGRVAALADAMRSGGLIF